MSQYGVTAQVTTTPNKPMLLLFGDGNVLPEINLIRIGFGASPTDALYKFALYEHTNAGSGGTALTPKRIGPGVPAACTAKRGTFTSDPTRTGIAMVTLTCHHRAVATVQKEFGAGYKPEVVAADRGLGLWCDASSVAANGEFAINWWE